MKGTWPVLACLLVILAAVGAERMRGVKGQPRPAPPALEYVAHASFVVESPAGTRVVLDPFNSDRWLGYAFPRGLEADAVLVSHPHYDHDASYYFPLAPAFRRPGRYQVGDVAIEGHAGRHAGPYGQDFGQVNTVWVVDTGGLRVAHLGDNGPLGDAMLSSLGRVDVLLAPMDAQDHILGREAMDALRQRLRPRLIVAMHYRLDGFHGLPASLGPPPVSAERLATGRLVLDEAALAPGGRTVLLQPSPAVAAWPRTLVEAWRLRGESRKLFTGAAGGDGASRNALTRAIDVMRRAAALAPGVLVFQAELAELLRADGQPAEALSILERALSASADQDAEYSMRARFLLASLLAEAGQPEPAAAHYRIVVEGSSRPAQVEAARIALRPPSAP